LGHANAGDFICPMCRAVLNEEPPLKRSLLSAHLEENGSA